jgi:thymidylate synthase
MQSYDDALKNILENGVVKKNRTGVDTIAIFGMQTRYRIDECFPLLTKRKIWPKSIFAELLWFLSGSSNNNDLEALDSKIWRPWVDEEFEKKHGYCKGSFGPVYGFNLRYFGGNFADGDKNNLEYGKNGYDQWESIINTLKNNPDSRRILFSVWNPKELYRMKLPPCHYTFQLDVNGDKLSGMLTQRSADYPIGVPANIQFYSAIIYILAAETGLKPYEFIHNTGDSHIYVDQIDAVKEYLSREPKDSPKLNYNKLPDIYCKNPVKEWLNCFEVVNYDPHPKINIPVAV